ncbi:MAG: hypothetical protein HY908_31260 [Myxococcales bacterium]|nr:hypothetical protein [Myxococcales bacterium]
MNERASYLLIAATLGLAACAPAGDAGDGVDTAPAPTGWQELVRLEADRAGSYCVRRTATQELFVGAIDASVPPWASQVLLSVGEPSGPDRTEACGPDAAEGQLLYASSSSAETFFLPDTVALHVPAGAQLLLRVEASAEAASPDALALELHGLAVGRNDVTAVADALRVAGEGVRACTLERDQFLFAVAPELPPAHRMTLTALGSFSGPTTLFDSTAEVATGAPTLLGQPVPMLAGERLELACASDVVGPSSGGTTAAQPCRAAVYRFAAGAVDGGNDAACDD